MPESEPKPRLVELVAPGAGQGYKAVLRNGKAVVVHEISAPAPEVGAAIPRIQRLAENRHPALAPVLAWGTDPNGIWVAVEPNEGTPLGSILSRGPLTPPAAAALGASLLSGVAALHEAGVAMGGFGAAVVRVTGNGEVRLSGHPAAAVRGAPSQSDLRADVRSCGMAICAAFGVDPAGAPAPQNVPPGLVVTMRSMASGAMGAAADRAQGALREMASALLAPDRMTAAQAELATRAGGREMPSITPFLPKEEELRQAQAQAAPAPQPPAPPPAAAPPLPVWTPPPPEDAPRKTISYEPPPRAVETYSNLPSPFQQTAPPAPAAPPPPPLPSAPSIPTWDAPAAAAPAPAEPEAPSSPPAQVEPPTPTPPQAPIPTWEPPAPAPSSSVPTWEPIAASAPAETPAPAPYERPAPGPAPYEPPARPTPAEVPAATSAPTPETARPSWTSIPTPSWSPTGEPAQSDAAEVGAGAAAAATAATVTQAPRPSSPAIPSAPARKPPATRRPSSGQPSERPRWLIPAIAAAVILLIVAVGGGILLASRGGPGGVATTSPSPKTSPNPSPSTSPSGGPQAVPTYAPATVPPVKSVVFCTTGKCTGDPTANSTCKINGPCRVTVEMKFTTAQRAEVAYIVKYFDRCTGTTTDLPGKSFTPPGYTTVDLTTNLTLPTNAKSAAIVAVTTSPASAASAPLLLGSNTC